MYSTGPPAPGGTTGAGGRLCVSRAVRRVFDAPARIAGDPGHRPHLAGYLSDLLAPYRLALPDGALDPAHGHSYGEMAEAMIARTVPAGQAVDLLVLAFAIPDVRPGRATATYLSQVCPGHPFAFAICDQGAAAGFTGLRLAGEYARTGGCRWVLLLVVEQAALPYHPGVPVAVPDRHAAVALLCGAAGPARVEAVRQHAGVAPERAGALLRAELAARSAGCPDLTLVLGGGLTTEAPETWKAAGAAEVRSAPVGQPVTGVWWALADELAGRTGRTEPARGRRMLLAEYDPALRYLCLSTVDIRHLAGEIPPCST